MVNQKIFSKAPSEHIDSLRLDINRGSSTPAVLFIYLVSIAIYNESNNIVDGTDFYADMETILLHTVYEKSKIESLRKMSDLSIDHKIDLLRQKMPI